VHPDALLTVTELARAVVLACEPCRVRGELG
jgi:hypothetical protein